MLLDKFNFDYPDGVNYYTNNYDDEMFESENIKQNKEKIQNIQNHKLKKHIKS